MPSSLLFAGLVGTWLAVFVPMAARSRRPMIRPSDAALSSRVLERPVRTRSGGEEVSMSDPVGTRYRPGRGGYDPEAAELAARARYTFRQRVVLSLVLLAVAGALVAVGLKVPEAWYVHAGAVVTLVVYLVNLRRQVRSEQQIRARRMARSAGYRRRPEQPEWPADEAGHADLAEHPEPPGRADHSDRAERRPAGRRSGRRSGRPGAGRGRVIERDGRSGRRPRTADPAGDPVPETVEDDLDELSAHLLETPAGTRTDDADPVGEDPADEGSGLEETVGTSALPLLEPVPLPAQPAGTRRLELDDEDPELHYLDHPGEPWGYRRAAGQ